MEEEKSAKLLGRRVFVTVVCIGAVRLVYAIVREQSLVDAIGQTLIALLIASILLWILSRTDRKRQAGRR